MATDLERVEMTPTRAGSAAFAVQTAADRAFAACSSHHLDAGGVSPATSAAKRALDVIIAALALLLLAPLFVLVGVVIWIESPGAVLFRQRRGGLGGAAFVIYKFRSMTVAEDGEGIRHASRADPRVTRVGAVLRRTSIDELPQLINVLKGDMSLVGPRPHALAHDAFYAQQLSNYGLRQRARPGLTGLAQVSGARGEIRGLSCMRQRVAHDIAYIESWSLWLDLKLLALTFIRTPFDDQAY